MKKDIRLEVRYRHTPERVWRVLTDPALISKWLMETDFQPVVGRQFTLRMPPRPGFDGTVHGQVLVCDPPHRLSYSWRGSEGWGEQRVSFTLAPTPDGTLLVLEHTGFAGLKQVLLSWMMSMGWGKKLQRSLPLLLDELRAAA